ncbi:hypothetical protein [Collimonas sp. OK242]|uniref:hypothetical protein n=1 Tax=Collimonas sp. OK242 TaxID=1798195 RepID=UPI0015A1E314|nr:hypothetical protein [Collimonas sp. OK242]
MKIIVTSVAMMTGVTTTEAAIIARQDKPKKVIAEVWLRQPDPIYPSDQAWIHAFQIHSLPSHPFTPPARPIHA